MNGYYDLRLDALIAWDVYVYQLSECPFGKFRVLFYKLGEIVECTCLPSALLPWATVTNCQNHECKSKKGSHIRQKYRYRKHPSPNVWCSLAGQSRTRWIRQKQDFLADKGRA